MRIAARCPQDGVVEAIEFDANVSNAFAIGIQWHPERTYNSSTTSRNIFTALVRESALWQPPLEPHDAH